MRCNIKERLQKAHSNSESVKRFDFKPQSVVDVLTRSWGEVMHSLHVNVFQSHPCLENNPSLSLPHPHGQVGAAVEAHGEASCPLAMLTKAPPWNTGNKN